MRIINSPRRGEVSLFGKISLVMVGVAAAFLLFDFVLFLKDYVYEKNEYYDLDTLYSYDDKMGWKLIPGKSALSKTLEYDVTYKINNVGYRDDNDYQFQKDSARTRIAVIGDSFVFGIGVENASTFPKLIERKTGAEVLNFGVPAYDPAHYYLFLEELEKYKPDKVILTLFLANDIGPVNSDKGGRYGKPYLKIGEDDLLALHNVPVLRRENSEEKKGTKWAVGHRATLFVRHFLKEVVLHTLNKTAFSQALEDKYLGAYDEQFLILEEVMRAYKNIYEENLVAIIIPQKDIEFNYLWELFDRKVTGLLEKLNIAFYNITPSVLQEQTELYFPKDGHLNETGHSVVAEGIVPLLAFP